MKISNMTKREMAEELRRHGYDASELDWRDELRDRLQEARGSKRERYRWWRRVMRTAAAR